MDEVVLLSNDMVQSGAVLLSQIFLRTASHDKPELAEEGRT